VAAVLISVFTGAVEPQGQPAADISGRLHLWESPVRNHLSSMNAAADYSHYLPRASSSAGCASFSSAWAP
jgi:hypothetical protein